MRHCLHCGTKLGLLFRGQFCSQICSDSFRQDEAGCWDASGIDDPSTSGDACIELGEIEPVKKGENIQASAADEARRFIWTGILASAKRLGKRQPAILEPQRSVVQLRQGSAEVPLYFIGGGLDELRLSQLMHGAFSVYAVEVRWAWASWLVAAEKNQTDALPTLEQLAAEYVTAMGSHVQSSPCVLAGYSFRGVIAFEAARQLKEQGGKVEMVILLDTEAKYPTWLDVAWVTLQKAWREGTRNGSTGRGSEAIVRRLTSSCEIIYRLIVQAMNGMVRRFLKVVLPDPEYSTTNQLHFALIRRVYDNALKFYHLRCLDCRGVLFRADPKHDSPARAVDGSRGWDKLFGKGLEIMQMSGDHQTMVRQKPHRVAVALEMSKLIDRFSKKPTQLSGRRIAK